MEIKEQERTEKTGQEIAYKRKEAEIKGKIEADGQFIEELADTEKETKERSELSRDMASLSDDNGNEKLNLQELLNWNPSVTIPFTDQIQSLNEIYAQLMKELASHTNGQGLEKQLAALNQLLSDLLIKLLDTSTGELRSLFKDFGSKDSMRNLQNNLYHSVSGKFLDKRELECVFRESEPEKDSLKSANIHMPGKDMEDGSKQGIIYQLDRHGRIKDNRQYTQRMQKEGQTLALTTSNQGEQTSLVSIEGNRIYTPKDIEKAEAFARYINYSGNSFLIRGLSGGSEELYGFLAAVMALKSHTFLTFSGIDEGLSFDLREAMESMIDYYIQKEGKGKKAHPFEPKTAYKIYYYMMNLYKRSGNLEETVNKGLRHAYQKYLRKKDVLQKEDTGSFFSKELSDALKDWKKGKSILEEDYKRYYEFLTREDLGGVVPEFISISPWGMFVESYPASDKANYQKPIVVFGTVGVILLVIGLIAFLFV